MDADRIPVIVGLGETIDRTADPAASREPMALMADALRAADGDAGGGLLAEVDSLDIVMLMSWRYRDLAARLCEAVGIAPARAVLGPVGGESPVRFLHEAAQRIARGDSRVAAIVGGEAQYTVSKARREGITLPWTPFEKRGPGIEQAATYLHPLAVKLGVYAPTNVYPFYDAASAAASGQTPAEALAESGTLWGRFAEVAAANPYGWTRSPPDADTIVTPTADNRLIAWPYTKSMVANPNVNQSAALIVTSLARARAAGIAEDRLVFVIGGARANEPRDYLARDGYAKSHAQDAVLEAMLAMAGGDPAALGALELYSCFPCVPKMARRTLGLGNDVLPTVTGGLSFFGAPLNNYITHAACAMVRTMRGGAEAGLLYGQGEYVTKHHALRLARTPASAATLLDETNAQDVADRGYGPVPPVIDGAAGAAAIESFTVLYDRDGAASHGVIIARTDDGERTLARVPGGDADTLALLTDDARFPIGARGSLRLAADGISDWTPLG